ncbi:MAG: VanZ family protein [Gammaproteobacteria bacterium]|nr:VanZ family protein [Gammaproteobacteria bacterium]
MEINARLRLCRQGLLLSLLVITVLAVLPLQHTPVEHINDKLLHTLAFVVLAGLADFSLPRSGLYWRMALGLVGYGLLLECLQYFLPYRSFSLLDLLADGAGVIGYRLLVPLWRRIPLLTWRWRQFD